MVYGDRDDGRDGGGGDLDKDEEVLALTRKWRVAVYQGLL